MSKIYKKSFLILIVFNFLLGCQTLKDGLEGNKKSKSAEEFLIEKKNPLTLPPDFTKLPTPENTNDQDDIAKEFDIGDILKKGTSSEKNKIIKDSNNSLENSILKKINK